MDRKATRYFVGTAYPQSDSLHMMGKFSARRLRELREELGISQSELARRSSTSQQTINRLEADLTDNPRNILAIARALNTTPEYLMGESDDPSGREPVDHRRPSLAHADNEKSAASACESEDMVQVAEIDLRFGLGTAIMDEEVTDHQPAMRSFPRAWLRHITKSAPSELYWAKGQGDSMEPTIGDGDIILIDRSQNSLMIEDVYWACAYGHAGMVKRLRQMPDGSVKILSNNPHVPPETAYDGELHIFGRVIAVVKKI